MNLTTAVILIVGTVLLVGYGLSRQIRQGLAAGMDLTPGADHLNPLNLIPGIATNVNNLYLGLTNITKRGNWGEHNLQLILDDFLTKGQYEKQKETVPGSRAHVDFAIKMPGRKDQEQVWLPVDAKFPLESYRGMQEALNNGDPEAYVDAKKKFENAVIKSATEIKDLYVHPPHTTNFGVLYLCREGLFHEALDSDKIEKELAKLKVYVAGPSTISALLDAWRVGFHTLALEERASEVWDLLHIVEDEYDQHQGELNKLVKNLDHAQGSAKNVQTRINEMKRKIRALKNLPGEDTGDIPDPADLAETEPDDDPL
jgi:DNA recombination protein RmuC